MKLGNPTQWLLLAVTLLVAGNFYLDQLRRERIETLELNQAHLTTHHQMNRLFQVECVNHVNHLYNQMEATRCRCNEVDGTDPESPPGVEPTSNPLDQDAPISVEPLPKNELPSQ